MRHTPKRLSPAENAGRRPTDNRRAIRAALPVVKIAVDKWHLIALAKTMVTEVRQRVTRTLLDRRGTVANPIWVNRRLVLTGAEHLSTKQWNRLWRSFDT